MKGFYETTCFPTGRHYAGIAHLLRIAAAGVAEEFEGLAVVAHLPLVAIDTETTGRDPAVDRIVEVACIIWQAGEIVERLSWLVNPERPIPQEAFDVHGISDAEVKDAPKFGEILPLILKAIEGRIPVAYNAEFDRRMLMAEIGRVGPLERVPPAFRKGVDWIDPLVWARELHRTEKSRALSEVAERLGIPFSNAHRAANDAEVTLKVFAAFMADARVPVGYGPFIAEQRRLFRAFEDERLRWRNWA